MTFQKPFIIEGESAPLDSETISGADGKKNVPYQSHDRDYTVIWLNGDGSQLDSKTYTEGQDEPTTDKTPVKESDAENVYTFSKWDDVWRKI